ncbi:hypothetical protein [Clostridium sp.]|uniref:hypothetical protein n=1 Tax=Clostridium sp. TaxID=1506 RepID=UPI002617B7E6|nr:hypothetical protein [Clostridium sp.]
MFILGIIDYDVLSNISGLDSKTMKVDFEEIVNDKRIIVPILYLNYKKLGLTMKMFIIRLFQIIPCYRKA